MLKNAMIAVLLACLFSACENKPETPNILFLFADDWGYYASCFADPDKPGINDCFSTPAMDRLAEEGISFTNFYAGCSVCAPSRVSPSKNCWSGGCGAMSGAKTAATENSTIITRPKRASLFFNSCCRTYRILFTSVYFQRRSRQCF